MILITPHVSEKTYKLVSKNIYVFDVPLSANKAEVQAAIKAEYPNIKIADVRLMIQKGKVKSVNRGKRSRPGQASRKDTKKAYVTVKEGKIEIAGFKEMENKASETSEASVAQPSTVSTESGAVASAPKRGLFAKRRTGNRGDK